MEEKVYDRQITKLAVASRVVDEMQIERHFTDEQIRELYSFRPEPISENPETPQLPKVLYKFNISLIMLTDNHAN